MLDLNFALVVVCVTVIALVAIVHREINLAQNVVDGFLHLTRDALNFLKRLKFFD